MRPVATDEQEQLREAVTDLCRREVTVKRLQAWESGADADELTLREQVARLGWIGLGLPGSVGGSGAPLTDVAMLIAASGQGLLPRSVIGAIASGTALTAIAPGSASLGAIASGDNRVTIAFEEENAREIDSLQTTVEGGVVRGNKAYVADADAELHVVVAREGNEPVCVLVDASGSDVTATPLQSFGGDRQAHVAYDGAPVLERLRGREGAERLDQVRKALALAEMVGGMQAVVDMAVAYVQEREQFGQKIALFQAVRHQIAEMGIRLTASRHLAWQAITRVDRRLLQGHELESALVFVGRAFREACFTAHHVHGGAGFVVEHALHFHSERAQSLAIRYASERPALAAIASALLD